MSSSRRSSAAASIRPRFPACSWPPTGPLSGAPDPGDAVENAVALEAVAALALHSLALQPELGPVELDLLDRHFARKHGETAYYGQEK